jgi:predicted nucleic-acid-binding protein
MISFDTNIVLRLMLRDLPDQADKIISIIEKEKSGSIMIADAVLFEAVWVMSSKVYRLDRPLIGKLLLQIAEIPQINCNRKLLEQAVPLYIKHRTISFIDACLAVYAELNQATPLLTSDKQLASSLPKSVKKL